MVRLAEVKYGQRFLDPMCGVGTILAECLAVQSKSTVIGGDLEPTSLRSTQTNLRRQGTTSLVRWDARQLPLKDQSIDRLVCNPPFGKQLSRPDQIGPLYRRLLTDWNRVLRPRGRAVLLASDAAKLNEAAKSVGWHYVRHLRVRVLGLPASMSVWRKE